MMAYVLALGLAGCAGLAAMLIWSIAYPNRRLWPPRQITVGNQIGVWSATLAIFCSAIVLGIADWNGLSINAAIRWSLGLPMILLSNVAVWSGVFQIGVAATSGAADELKTDGLYAWSRNPQYVADIIMLAGWGILSASLWALPVVAGGIVVLALAPLAEEPWLEEVYGEIYRRYRMRVRRFF